MKIKLRLFVAGLLGTFALAACGPTGPKRPPQDGMVRLERSLVDIRNLQAEHTSKLVALEQRVRTLSGRLDELERFEHARLGGEVTALKEDIGRQRQGGAVPPEIVPLETLKADFLLAGRLRAREAGRVFADALSLLQTGNYRRALPLLDDALSLGDNEEFAPQMLFWRGVCYDGLEDNRGALLAYGEVISRFPKHERTAMALLRQAEVFVRFGDKETAKLTLRKLLAEFPASREASPARERLGQL